MISMNMCVKSLPKEKWVWVPGYKRAYAVSSLGRVRSYYSWRSGPRGILPNPQRILSAARNNYHVVGLVRNGRVHHRYVSRLVLAAFIGSKPASRFESHHKDGNILNNRSNNLEWAIPPHFATKRIARKQRRVIKRLEDKIARSQKNNLNVIVSKLPNCISLVCCPKL